VLVAIGDREVLNSSFINCFNLFSTKGQFLNSCATCWQYAPIDAISIVGYGFITGILHWIGGYSTIPITSTFNQTFWVTSCVCWTLIGITTASTSFSCCWELD
jgi:hypothetical protein